MVHGFSSLRLVPRTRVEELGHVVRSSWDGYNLRQLLETRLKKRNVGKRVWFLVVSTLLLHLLMIHLVENILFSRYRDGSWDGG